MRARRSHPWECRASTSRGRTARGPPRRRSSGKARLCDRMPASRRKCNHEGARSVYLMRAALCLTASLLAFAASAQDGEWRMPAKDYASTRYSTLEEINAGNVKTLKPVFTFTTGVERGHKAAPLFADGLIFIVTPFPNFVYALDEKGAVKWKFDPQTHPSSQGVACCDVVNRGAAYDGGRLFFNTLDNHTIALDARSGKELWRTRLGDIALGETMTMAPLVVKGKVLVGNSGGELGVRGWLTALDASSGKIVWRAYSTGPDKEVLIGPQFRPFYAADRGKDLGVTSWPPDAWKLGGGNTWGWISYDPQLNLIYYGTGNPGPWNPDERPGDNKWTTGVFARDVNTGEALWFYQTTPHDLFDHDDINESILADIPSGSGRRPVLLRPGRNGFFYVMDRRTGQVLSATPYGYVNGYRGVDLKSGRISVNPEKVPKQGRVTRDICPAAPGLKDWNPLAF